MVKPYFEAVRIARSDDGLEHEYEVIMLFSSIVRLENPSNLDDDFKNQSPKTVLWLDNGTTPWLLIPYKEMKAAWLSWLDAASNIQSVFTNN